jgi:dipeptidase
MRRIALLAALCTGFIATASLACTSLLVTPGASADGSAIITYTCDAEFHAILERSPAADHEPGALHEITDWNGTVRGTLPEVPHTYAVVGLMNEHQLAIGETTFGGRPELHNPEGLLHYWDLMQLALQRARTAREAIEVITTLVDEHGYRSTGESFSIADTREAWILEMIGPGSGGEGAIWVAVRVPDGSISAHANKARIGEFPLDDPQNCLYSPNVIDVAIERGYFDPDAGEPFRFCDAYCPATPPARDGPARECGASSGGRPPPSTFRPTTTAPSPAPSPTPSGSGPTASSPSPTSSTSCVTTTRARPTT